MSHGARSGEYGECGKTVVFSDFKNCFIRLLDVYDGKTSLKSYKCYML